MAKKVIPQGPGVETLPPAGDEQREILTEREDTLQQAAEERADTTERGSIDPRAFRIESELAQHFNELEVSNQDPAYSYCWVQSGFYGRMVKAKLAEGWEVVQGDLEEAIELKGMGADTTRRLGDVILMRVTKDRHLILKRRERLKREAQELSVTGTLSELAEKYRQLGLVVHTDLKGIHPNTVKTMQVRAQARQTAARTMDHWLRDGRMPGAPAPR